VNVEDRVKRQEVALATVDIVVKHIDDEMVKNAGSMLITGKVWVEKFSSSYLPTPNLIYFTVLKHLPTTSLYLDYIIIFKTIHKL